jgi:hypothetical protein
MKIELRKITRNLSPFKMDRDDISFEGTFQRISFSLIEVKAIIEANLDLQCDRCGCEIHKKIKESISLKVNEGCFKGEDLDIFECHSSCVDFEEILISEIEAIKSDYHYCDDCEDNE